MNSSESSLTEQSNIVYIDILDEYADNKDTILHALSVLQDKLQVGTKVNFLGVVGDGKTYFHLHTLKIEYGSDLNWLIPLPGDWHILKNYQEVLMKVYFEAGLKDAAKSIGYTEGVLNSIASCGKFKKIHLFLLRIWEAIFRVFLESFVSDNQTGSTISTQIKVFEHTEGQTTTPDASALLNLILHTCDDEGILKREFMQYLSKLSALDDTCQLWAKFVLEDCLPYIGLFISIRSGNWNLRLSSLKEMAAVFTAYDRTTYQKLIPRYIAEMLRAPPEVLSCLQRGGFAVSLTGMATIVHMQGCSMAQLTIFDFLYVSTGKLMHSVGIDEAHEMCINKEGKSSFIRPTKDNFGRLVQFFSI